MTWQVERAPQSEPAGAERRVAPTLLFALEDPVLPPTRLGPVLLSGSVGALAGAAMALAMHPAVVTVAAVVLVIALSSALGGGWVERRRRQRAIARSALSPRLRLADGTLSLVDQVSESMLVRVDRPFGATLFSTPSRDLVVLALTHRDGVTYVGGRVPSGERHTELLARALTTPVGELPVGPGVPIFARGDRLLDLVAALEVVAPGVLDRLFLSDAGMADVVLDRQRLRAGQLDFDLRLRLSWRAFSFQEGSAIAASSFQATAVRQAEREVVLVALSPSGELATPSLVAPPPGTPRTGPLSHEAIQRALARDLRLARGLAEMPPARAQRIAVDRLFMPRLRLALDAAPQERLPTPIRPSAQPPIDALHTPPDGVEQLRSSRP
ncbi:MAG: hypothetical protein NVSMB47_05110 [Polyangiales bacterium]